MGANSQVLSMIVLVLLLFGCTKVNKENYHKLKMGQDYADVVKILGNPDQCSDMLGATSCMWGTEEENIQAMFMHNKLLVQTARNIR